MQNNKQSKQMNNSITEEYFIGLRIQKCRGYTVGKVLGYWLVGCESIYQNH